MSSNNYYYYPQNPGQYSGTTNQQAWNNWPADTAAAHQNYEQSRNASSYNYQAYSNQGKQSYDSRSYANVNTQNHRYNASQSSNRGNRYESNQYNKSVQPPWKHNRNQPQKRVKQETPHKTKDAPIVNVARKKKKPLSQNISKKGWNEEDAEKAYTVEREFNSKSHSLVIKFPDPELNKEIVKEFHPAIENVHFQQASTPRFCFVTLHKDADIDLVMSALNRQKFGQGYLTAELKKDKDEEQVTSKDIDPYTLYVGNLSNEVTKQAVRNKYPKTIRIDIGYAQKMKYTRYAFVRFATVCDSIEAFKDTYNSDLYSRSLIVRFRRLQGHAALKNNKLLNPLQTAAVPEADAEPGMAVNVNANDDEPKNSDERSSEALAERLPVDLNLVKDEPESGADDDSDEDFWKMTSSAAAAAAVAADAPELPVDPANIKRDESDRTSDESDFENAAEFEKRKSLESSPLHHPIIPVKIEPGADDYRVSDIYMKTSEQELTRKLFSEDDSDSTDSEYGKESKENLKNQRNTEL